MDCILQEPAYPTGCESVSTVMALQYLGFDISCDDFIEKYLDTTRDWSLFNIYQEPDILFNHYFFGNPASSSGWLCFPPVIKEAVEEYFMEISCQDWECIDMTGSEFDDLLEEINQGYPCVIWVSNGYVKLQRHEYDWGHYYTPSHTVLLKGYSKEEDSVFIADPLDGNLTIEQSIVEELYNTYEKKCIVIKKRPQTVTIHAPLGRS